MTARSEKWITVVIILILLNLALTLAGLFVLRKRVNQAAAENQRQQEVLRRVDRYIKSWEDKKYPKPENWDLRPPEDKPK